jgi:hypothetical protein
MMASDIVAMFSGTITLVAAYNPATGTYQSYIPMFPPTNFVLTPGKGYWCYCTGSGTFTYTV